MHSLTFAIDAFLEAASAVAKWRIVRAEERKLKRAIAKAFKRQGREFLTRFATLESRFSEAMILTTPPLPDDEWGPLFSQAAEETMPDFVDPIVEGAETAMLAGAEATSAEVGIEMSFKLTNPRAVTYIEAHGAVNVRNINETTRDGLRVLLRHQAEEGWSYSKTARMIRTQFEGFAGLKPQAHIKDRATLVAVTEIGNAYETGSYFVGQDLTDAGLQMEVHWLTVNDDKVSDGCKENQDAGWIPFGTAFPSGHMHPLRFPGCRCTHQIRRKRS